MTFLTEAEAKVKWCPHARTLDWDEAIADEFVGASINRSPGKYDHSGSETVVVTGRHRCIGSACMAWRWEAYRRPDDRSTSEPRGYCGAFGIPMESIV